MKLAALEDSNEAICVIHRRVGDAVRQTDDQNSRLFLNYFLPLNFQINFSPKILGLFQGGKFSNDFQSLNFGILYSR